MVYLVIKNNSSSVSYRCSSTHTSVPYLKVRDQYLDLTTNLKSGLGLKVKSLNNIYMPVQTSSRSTSYSSATTVNYSVSTTTSSSGTRASTSGYSGRSTYTVYDTYSYGYSGRSSSGRTTGWGYRSTSSTYRITDTWGWSCESWSTSSTLSGYSGKRASTYTSATSWTGITKTSTRRSEWVTRSGSTLSKYGSAASGQGNVTSNASASKTSLKESKNTPIANWNPVSWAWGTGSAYTVGTNPNKNTKWGQVKELRRTTHTSYTSQITAQQLKTATRTSTYTSYDSYGMSSATAMSSSTGRWVTYTSWSRGNANYYTAMTSSYTTRTTSDYYTTDFQPFYGDFTAYGTGIDSESWYTSGYTSNGMYATTRLTRSSSYSDYDYMTSTAPGVLKSTTALTRSSSYTTTQSTSRDSSSSSSTSYTSTTSESY